MQMQYQPLYTTSDPSPQPLWCVLCVGKGDKGNKGKGKGDKGKGDKGGPKVDPDTGRN